MTIKEQVIRLEKNVTKDLRWVRSEISGLKDSVDKRIKPMEDYFVGLEAVAEAKKQGTISINEDVWNVLKWLILIVAGLAGVKLL